MTVPDPDQGRSLSSAERRIGPPLSAANASFWLGGGAGQLMIRRCQQCRRWCHPPGESCPECGFATSPERASGRGHVFTFTVCRHRFHPEVEVPYVVAIVELVEQEGLRFTTNIVGCPPEIVWIGMPVTVRFERALRGLWVPVFGPASGV